MAYRPVVRGSPRRWPTGSGRRGFDGRRVKPEPLQARLRGFREPAVGRPRVRVESTRGEPLRTWYAQAREPGTWSRRPGFTAPMAYRTRARRGSMRRPDPNPYPRARSPLQARYGVPYPKVGASMRGVHLESGLIAV